MDICAGCLFFSAPALQGIRRHCAAAILWKNLQLFSCQNTGGNLFGCRPVGNLQSLLHRKDVNRKKVPSVGRSRDHWLCPQGFCQHKAEPVCAACMAGHQRNDIFAVFIRNQDRRVPEFILHKRRDTSDSDPCCRKKDKRIRLMKILLCHIGQLWSVFISRHTGAVPCLQDPGTGKPVCQRFRCPPHSLKPALRTCHHDDFPGRAPQLRLLRTLRILCFCRADLPVLRRTLHTPLALCFCLADFPAFFHPRCDLGVFSRNPPIVLRQVRNQAAGTVLYSFFRIAEVSPAVRPQHVERTIAEKTVKPCRIRDPVAGKIFTFRILEKGIMHPLPVRFFPLITHLRTPLTTRMFTACCVCIHLLYPGFL